MIISLASFRGKELHSDDQLVYFNPQPYKQSQPASEEK